MYTEPTILYSRQRSAGPPRASPWFAWIATLAFLWNFRGCIAKTVLSIAPFKSLKRRYQMSKLHPNSFISSINQMSKIRTIHAPRNQNYRPANHRKHNSTGIKTRVKRLCTGDGPLMSSSSTSSLDSQNISYRVTRSGKIYGKYPIKRREIPSPATVRPSRPQPTFYRRKYSKFIKTSPELVEGRRSESHVNDKDQIGYPTKFL